VDEAVSDFDGLGARRLRFCLSRVYADGECRAPQLTLHKRCKAPRSETYEVPLSRCLEGALAALVSLTYVYR